MNFLIFPTQLYFSIDILKQFNNIYLIEEPKYFTYFKFHKLKLAYHRVTMKKYYQYLKSKKLKVKYINFYNVTNDFYLNLQFGTFYDPIDKHLEKKLKKYLTCNIIDQCQFLISKKEIHENKNNFETNGKYYNDKFYKYMRIKLDILIDKNKKPIGNKWSFDNENRIPLPKEITIPKLPKILNNDFINEAKDYVNKHFKDNYGSLDYFIYPIDHKSSLKWLKNFLENRLDNFGPYEDAVSTEYNFIYHSVLTPMMNIGLLLDKDVINESIKFYENNKISIASFEGFIRQIIGWRQYTYALYELESDNLYSSNILNHTNKISNKWWESVNITPIDFLIDKIKKYAYVHHIERLMYLSNWMLLNEIDPKEVYRIFMEWTIDAYEWVMIPNIFGMGQYANPLMMSRLYFSSSNYILKMSNFKNDDTNWTEIWNAVYYNFINNHKQLLSKNYATAMQVKHWKNKTLSEQKELINIAKKYQDTLLNNYKN